jgi:hypothetical protein
LLRSLHQAARGGLNIKIHAFDTEINHTSIGSFKGRSTLITKENSSV